MQNALDIERLADFRIGEMAVLECKRRSTRSHLEVGHLRKRSNQRLDDAVREIIRTVGA